MTQPSRIVAPPVTSNAVLARAPLECGWVTIHAHTFFSDRLAFLFDRLQRSIEVDVTYDPDDPSRAWIFDPDLHVWLKAGNLHPRQSNDADSQRKRRSPISHGRIGARAS